MREYKNKFKILFVNFEKIKRVRGIMITMKEEETKIISELSSERTEGRLQGDITKDESFKDPEKLIDLFIDKPGEKKEPVKLGEFELNHQGKRGR